MPERLPLEQFHSDETSAERQIVQMFGWFNDDAVLASR